VKADSTIGPLFVLGSNRGFNFIPMRLVMLKRRFGPKNRFRVLYEIEEAERKVLILAIGEKDGNRLFVSGEEIEL
jgi:hypothetical protein